MASLGMERILKADIKDLTKTFLEDMFASYHDKETGEYKQANFATTEEIVLTEQDYKYVKGKIKTTLGMLFMNRYILEQYGIIEHLGYWNKSLDIGGLNDLTTEINNLALTDKITMQQLGNYIDARDRLGFWCAAFLSVSISPALIRPMNNVEQRKKELFEQYKNEINSDNPVQQTLTVNKIEKELMAMVRENLKDDYGYDLYRSGDGNLDNNYKTINVMRGSVFNEITRKYDVVESSLMNGIKKKDITPFANSVVAAAYPSAVGTAEAGYMEKIVLAMLQSESIDPDINSDCGTTSTIPVTITKKNKKYFLYRYIDDNGRKVLFDLHNVGDYVGKTVRLYSPQCCCKNKICAKCAGTVFNVLGVENVGLILTQFTDKMLNIKLKSKHDLSQNAGIIPDDYIFLDKNNYYTTQDGILKNKVKCKFFVPHMMEETSGFVREATAVECLGVFPVKFYDKDDNEIFATEMIIPIMMHFNIYNEIQEDDSSYIITYDADSEICNLAMQKTLPNIEYYVNNIYFYSKIPLVPYNMLTELMWRSIELNGLDLTGPSITYELMARRLCRHGKDSYAVVYGKDQNCDPLGYTKLGFREAVQESGVLQAVVFQDISTGMNKGLAQTLNGHEPTETPLEKIIKA